MMMMQSCRKLPQILSICDALRVSLTELWAAQRLERAEIRLNIRALENEITKGIYIIPCLDSAIMSELHSMVDL